MPILNLGKVRTVWKGTYNSATTYTLLDGVDYNGSSYILKVDSSLGNPPTSTAYWSLSSLKGVDGTDGTNGTNGTTPVYSLSGTVLTITT